MINMTEVTSVWAVVELLLWACVVHGVAWVVFDSFWFRELDVLIAEWSWPQEDRMRALKYEIKVGLEYVPGADLRSPTAAQRRLSIDEVRQRQAERVAIGRGSFWFRAVVWGVRCDRCHVGLAAIAVWLVTRPPSLDGVFSVLAVCTVIRVALWVGRRGSAVTVAAQHPAVGGQGCGVG